MADLTQDQLAQQEHTAERLLSASGFELDMRPRITFHAVPGTRGRVYEVPGRLPSLPPHKALATVELPLSLDWSQPGREYRLRDRSDRARAYGDELVLPRDVRAAWEPLISELVPA